MNHPESSKLKLAAVDLDGTLLTHEGKISEPNARAIQRLQNAGVQVVLASGRHYNNMRRFAVALPGVQWLVSCQGGELSNIDRTEILHREFLPAGPARETIERGRSLGFATLVYAVEDIFRDSDWNPRLKLYADLTGYLPIRNDPEQLLQHPIFKTIWVGEPAGIERALEQTKAGAKSVQTVRTHAEFLEFVPTDVSKASALKILADRLGVKATETIAFGDGDNDVPMFEWAGVSMAMAHGWPAAIRKATYVTPTGPADTALARGVDLIFEKIAAGSL